MSSHIVIQPVTTKAQRKHFVELPYRLYASDPHWVPPLKSEVYALLTPKKNPFFEHATVQLFLAEQDGKTVGRISAHFDHLALEQPVEKGMGPGTGNWGLLEAENEAATKALIDAAEKWLKEQGMHRVIAPLSLSVWDEPGLLTTGHDHSPTVMMGHHKPEYQSWVENGGYKSVKKLVTYELAIDKGLPPLIDRIVKSGERSSKLKLRKVDKAHFDRDAKIIMDILNDAWSDNWGFVPLTDHEIDHVGVKLKPIVYEDLIMIAELEGRPVAFMMTLPDLNDRTKNMKGSLLPFNWAKLLWWLKFPKSPTMRVPLMGVVKELQGSRMASQMAFMMIEYIRREAVGKYGATRGELGWVLDDNQGMIAIADAIESKVNRVYTLYEKNI